MKEASGEARKKHAGIPVPHHVSGGAFAYGTARPRGQVPNWPLIAVNRLPLNAYAVKV